MTAAATSYYGSADRALFARTAIGQPIFTPAWEIERLRRRSLWRRMDDPNAVRPPGLSDTQIPWRGDTPEKQDPQKETMGPDVDKNLPAARKMLDAGHQGNPGNTGDQYRNDIYGKMPAGAASDRVKEQAPPGQVMEDQVRKSHADAGEI